MLLHLLVKHGFRTRLSLSCCLKYIAQQYVVIKLFLNPLIIFVQDS
jgi:hypothetical protein